MATPGSASREGSGRSAVDSIGNLLGLLIAAFVGALNFFGLRSGELSAILRSETPLVTFVFVLMLAAVATALASFFFSEEHRTAPLSAWGAFLLCLSVTAVSIAAVRVPGFTKAWSLLAWSLGALLFVVAGVLFGMGYWRGHQSGLPRKLVLISCSIILLSAGVLAAARLETRSQVQATYPQLGATIKVENGVGELTMRMKASKLKDGDRVLFWVQGAPRDDRKIPKNKRCSTGQETQCFQELCRDSDKHDPCSLIGTGTVNPDALGKVEQGVSTFFPAQDYRLLVVEAVVCEVSPQRKDVYQGCRWNTKYARLYLRV